VKVDTVRWEPSWTLTKNSHTVAREQQYNKEGLLPKLASPVQAFKETFISGTKVDLEEYRLGVRDALQDCQIGYFLFDYDAQPAIPVVDYCIDRLEKTSDAYLGIYGHRYGWIPDSRPDGKSITQLEYETACTRWVPRERHRLFLFRPEPGSEAERELKARADKALERDFPDDGSCLTWDKQREESRKKQEDFLKTISTLGVIVNLFKNCDDLKRRAPLAVRNGAGWIDRRASPTRGRPFPSFDAAGFGAVGRSKQLEFLHKAYRTLSAREDAPALCAIVHGGGDMGHRWFADYLLQWPAWQAARTHSRLIPPGDRTEVAWLRNSMATELTPAWAAPTSDFATLAAVIRDRCLTDPTVVILDRVERFRNGLEGFCEGFWVPLHRALREAWAQRPAKYRFVLVVMLRSPLPTSPVPAVWSGTGAEATIDYNRLIPVPKLNKFRKQDFHQYVRYTLGLWTIEREIIDRLAGDCVPTNVYGRLIDSNLIPETGRWPGAHA
jgi:hypothetical protein